MGILGNFLHLWVSSSDPGEMVFFLTGVGRLDSKVEDGKGCPNSYHTSRQRLRQARREEDAEINRKSMLSRRSSCVTPTGAPHLHPRGLWCVPGVPLRGESSFSTGVSGNFSYSADMRSTRADCFGQRQLNTAVCSLQLSSVRAAVVMPLTC